MTTKAVLRWGRSAYERDADLAQERTDAESMGLSWTAFPDATTPPPTLGRCDALVVTSKVKLTRDVLATFSGSLVLTTTSGYDHIDVSACGDLGLVVARLPEPRRDAVVEHALGALISLMRRFPELDAAARRAHWARADLPALTPIGLNGATVVVVGLGVIGRRMQQILTTLGAVVLDVDPAVPGTWTLNDALERADAVTIHCSLNQGSRGLFDRARLAKLSERCVLVNTARGPLLDVAAAVDRVERGRLRGLACDVFQTEPYPELAEQSAHRAVFFSPHSAGYTDDLGLRVAASVKHSLSAWRAGTPVPHSLPVS